MIRWIIGGAIIFLCVILEIHGFSISIYADVLSHPELKADILGRYRPIRSDEWRVFTPFAFSQYFTGFSMISDILRAAPTNIFLTYGQAAWHPAIIFRPAQIGYLFFDQGSGLAFFWVSRLVILFLVSFEFARLILQVDKKFCALYAIMIAFSPLAQWWWSVNSVAEILAAGQGLVICWKIYLELAGKRRRFVAGAGFLWCAGIFIFGIYPAWQVSFGYLFLFCIIAVSFDRAKMLKTFWLDKKFWLIGFLIVLAPILHAIFVSLDMIKIQMATEYPGHRFTLGGSYHALFFMTYGIDFILPFSDIRSPTNNCEIASFFSMMPLGFLIFFYLTVAQKKFDAILSALFAISALLIFWELIGIPAWLAKITLMSNVTDGRARAVIEFAQLAMVFRGLSLIKLKLPLPARIILSVAIAALSTFCIYKFLPEWFILRRSIPVFILTGASIFLFISPEIKRRLVILCVIMLAAGATINPVAAGVDSIYKIPVGQKIAEIVQNEVDSGREKSAWLAVDAPINFAIMFGAPTINCVNTYPDLERWKKIAADEKSYKIYNRYAHIFVKLQNAPTEFVLNGPDNFYLNLNVEDLPELNARYIFSNNKNLENFSTDKIKIQKIYAESGSFIYKIR